MALPRLLLITVGSHCTVQAYNAECRIRILIRGMPKSKKGRTAMISIWPVYLSKSHVKWFYTNSTKIDQKQYKSAKIILFV